ncbi:MAG: hypothetical protein ACI93T_003863 [Porticoccaceae bacterium]|jgi:hypothetical protein
MLFFVAANGAAIHNPAMVKVELHVSMQELSTDLLYRSPLSTLSAPGA